MTETPQNLRVFSDGLEFSLTGMSPGSDLLVAGIYFLVAGVLLWVPLRRAEISGHRWIFRLAALLGFLCGLPFLWGGVNPGPGGPPPLLVALAQGLSAAFASVAAYMVWRLASGRPELRSGQAQSPTESGPAWSTAPEMHKRPETDSRTLSSAVEHSSSMVVIIDTAGRVEYCNPAFCKVTGYSQREVLGRRVAVLKPDQEDLAAYKELGEALKRGDPWEGHLLEKRKNGEEFWCLKSFAPIRDREGSVTHYVGVSHDITALKNSEADIRRLAYHDPLTDLPNRILFKELLEKTLSQARRERTSCAVVVLDLDRFKNVNDSLGHGAGDELLIAVGQRVRECLREGDTVARMGGDVFAVILPGLQHPKLAAAAAATIQEAMNRPFAVAGQEIFITASLGISLFPGDHQEIDELLKMADAAMYHAKELGRNQFQYYDEIPSAATGEQLSLETSLRFAIEREELDVFYQPKFELHGDRCFTVEALLRWRHPERGMIAPGLFIPIAEETGLIAAIGEWVLRRVCRQIREWNSEGIDLAVAVNLSARQFRQKNLLERIDSILADSGVDCARLEFEITESAVMNDPEQTAEILRGLKERRLSVSIDDFGTGYSSLSYLRLFPVDILKIDQSFVRDIGTPRGDTRIIRAIIALAHSLDLTVVAEGVETAAQLEFLRSLHCDVVQGYYYSPPVPAPELVERLRALEKGGAASGAQSPRSRPGIH